MYDQFRGNLRVVVRRRAERDVTVMKCRELSVRGKLCNRIVFILFYRPNKSLIRNFGVGGERNRVGNRISVKGNFLFAGDLHGKAEIAVRARKSFFGRKNTGHRVIDNIAAFAANGNLGIWRKHLTGTGSRYHGNRRGINGCLIKTAVYESRVP